ncbi:hypothetical protein DLAC_09735 [Tieghemostelium lacteum]|uniref:Uncharacterized protein n=1 Tax=Tieghemostelium lacteum TaxID=361077 RepID=A0A151Z728_TIELA|nr:hypothetical protein DLAC_09735 [Tieghemostelium lacteum]|eukprot:KYQ89766.1 hypothetical protein DLAC_09735 [Tieghemostelium lacteum]
MARTKATRRKAYKYLPKSIKKYSEYYPKYLKYLSGKVDLKDKLNHDLISYDVFFISDILLNYDKFNNSERIMIYKNLYTHQLSKYAIKEVKDFNMNPNIDMELAKEVLKYIEHFYGRDSLLLFNPFFKLFENTEFSPFRIKLCENIFKNTYEEIKGLSNLNQLEITPKSFKILLKASSTYPNLLCILMTFFSKLPYNTQKECIQPIFKSFLGYNGTSDNWETFSQSLKLFSNHIGIDNTVKFLIDTLNYNEYNHFIVIHLLFHYFEAFDSIQVNFSTIIEKLLNSAFDNETSKILLLHVITKKFNKIEYKEKHISFIKDKMNNCTLSKELVNYLCVIVKRYPMSFEKTFPSYWKHFDTNYWYKILDTLMVSLGETFQTQYLDKYKVYLSPLRFWKSYKKYKFVINSPPENSKLVSMNIRNIQNVKHLWQIYLDIEEIAYTDSQVQQLKLDEIFDRIISNLQHKKPSKITKIIKLHLNRNDLPNFQSIFFENYLKTRALYENFINSYVIGLASNFIAVDNFGLPLIEKVLNILEKRSKISENDCVGALKLLMLAKENQFKVDYLILPWLTKCKSFRDDLSDYFHQLLLSASDPYSTFGDYVRYMLECMNPESVYRLVIDLVENPNIFTLNISHEIFSVKIQPNLFYQLVELVAPIQLTPTEIDLIGFDFILRNILNYSIELNLGKSSKINIISKIL